MFFERWDDRHSFFSALQPLYSALLVCLVEGFDEPLDSASLVRVVLFDPHRALDDKQAVLALGYQNHLD